jgi:glycosyltransferase involved in cell wall biosynthesis
LPEARRVEFRADWFCKVEEFAKKQPCPSKTPDMTISGTHVKAPKVSVGLPVYNGERFVSEAIEAVLKQSFGDLELIISDNASSDRTEQICRDYAASDKRVRYYRNCVNVGVNPNYRRVFSLSTAEYFKWVTHDDLQTLDFLEKSVPIMDRDRGIVVCYPRVAVIDQHGNVLKRRSYGLDTDSRHFLKPDKRLQQILCINWGSPPLYGLMRSSVLRRTPLLGSTYAADQVLLAELALHGRFHEIPEDLLLHREHAHRSVYENPSRHSLTAFQDPTNARGIIFPAWRVLRDYVSAIWRAPINWGQQLKCYVKILRWMKYHRNELSEDLRIAAKQLRDRRKQS